MEKLDFEGKTLLDCTNPLKPDLSGLEIGTTTSAGEMVARMVAQLQGGEDFQHHRLQQHARSR